MSYLLQFAADENGQDLIEYSLLITFIAIACLALIASGRPATNAVWQTANGDLTTADAVASGS
jgi:Flp pilus assembly pilin Flp